MEKERKITAPEWCEIEKVEIIDGAAVVTFKEKERKLPKSWKEFCEMYKIDKKESYINPSSTVIVIGEISYQTRFDRETGSDENLLPDRATAEAVLALCQLIQLRNAYNGDWVPDWTNDDERKWMILLSKNINKTTMGAYIAVTELYFKTEELRDEFIKYFRPLIEKLKPLYGIKKGEEK